MKRGSSRRLMLAPNSLAVAMVVPPLPGRHLLGRPLDGLHDVVIAGAAAEVALEPVPDLALGRLGIALEELRRRHDHARRAEPALQPVLLPEALLDRVQLAVLGHALDGLHLDAVALHGEERARLHRLAVDVNGAGAALARVAADVGAGEARQLADVVHEQQARLDLVAVLRAVDGHRDSGFHRVFLLENGVLVRLRQPDPVLVISCTLTRLPELVSSCSSTRLPRSADPPR